MKSKLMKLYRLEAQRQRLSPENGRIEILKIKILNRRIKKIRHKVMVSSVGNMAWK